MAEHDYDEPVAFSGFTPYLFVTDASAMSDWYQRVFGFTERERWSDDDGVVVNVALRAGSGELWLDAGQSRQADHWVGVWVDDVDAMYRRVKAAGLDPDPPVDKPYGVRDLMVIDPEGYMWGFIRRLSNS